jgi:hypothetical protein
MASVDDPFNQQFLSDSIQRADGTFDGEPIRRTSIVARGTDGNLLWEHIDNSQYSTVLSIGNHGTPLVSDPAVASWDTNRIDVFVVNQNQTMDHAVSTDGATFPFWDNWGAPFPAGAGAMSSPDVVSTRPGRLDLFAVGLTSSGPAIFHRGWENGNDTQWQNWGKPPGGLASGPAASAARGTFNEMNVYVITQDFVNGQTASTLWELTNSNPDALPTLGWRSWGNPGVQLSGDPDAASFRSMRDDVFVTDVNGQLWHFFNDATAVPGSGWDTTFLGQPSAGVNINPSVVSMGPSSLRVFVRGLDNTLWQGTYHFGPMGWSSLAGSFIGGPDAASW